jgi:branched-chain amino acid transport system permease protein
MGSDLKRYKLILLLVIFLFLVIVPNFLSAFYKQLLIEILIFGLFSLGFDIIFGFTGLLNFGMAAFFGLGGYITLLSVLHWHVNLWIALIITIIGCSLFSLLYGFLISRFKSHYFVAFTIVVSMIFFYIAMANRPLTGSDEGLTFKVPLLDFGLIRFSFRNAMVKYYFVLAICSIVLYAVWKFFRTPYGKAIIAVRENEDRARLLGYNTQNLQIIAFTLSGVVSGLGGALYALHLGFSSASSFFWLWTARSVWWTIIGGTGTLIGAFIGPGVLVFFEDLISSWNADLYLIIMGVIMIMVIILAPQGIVGSIQAIFARRGR